MTFKDRLSQAFGPRAQRARASRRGKHQQTSRLRFTPTAELLEARLAPAILMVSSLADSGAGSLRAAIEASVSRTGGGTGNDTIRFSSALDGKTIGLTTVVNDLTNGSKITGPSAFVITNGDVLVIDGQTGLNKGITITRCGTTAGRLFGVETTGTLLLLGLTLSGGTATGFTGGDAAIGGAGSGSAGLGGAIFNKGMVHILNSTLTRNTAQGGAGGASPAGGAGMGGAIFNESGTTVINNSTITGNTASGGAGGASGGPSGQGLGGGMFNQNGAIIVSNSTFSANAAAQGGRSIFSVGDGARASATITNSILGQSDTAVSELVVNTNRGGSSTVGGSTNLIRTMTVLNGAVNSLTGTVSADPLLGALDKYGGLTQTIALLPGSPALDAGISVGAFNTDQRGAVRAGSVDIGAFESSGFAIAVSSGSGQSTRVFTNFAAPLVATITANNASEPVAGGLVTFTPPASGATAIISESPATISAFGTASVTATAAGSAASYTISAAARGSASTASFSLNNTHSLTSFSQLSSQSITYGLFKTLLAGHIGFGTQFPTGSSVSITLDGAVQSAVVDGAGNFSILFTTVSLGVGTYTVTYAFAQNATFSTVTNSTTTLTVVAGVGLTIDDGMGPLAELPLLGYSWGASNPSGARGAASLQNFTVTLAPTSAEPGLWGRLAVGSRMNSATIHVRRFFDRAEYATYTLTNVSIVSFSTSGSDRDAPQATIELAFDSLSESYRPNNASGPLGPPNTATYNQKSGKSSASGSLTDPSATNTPPVGLAFVVGTQTLQELSVANYSWGATNPGGTRNTASLQSFTVTLAPTSAEPGLWGLLVAGSDRTSAIIRVRSSTRDGPVEYLTYTLTNASITSFSTSTSNAGAPPQVTIQLAYDSVSESYSAIRSDGSLSSSAPNRAQYNRVTGFSGATGSLSVPARDSSSVGLTLNREELAVASYTWGASNPSGGKGVASLQSFTLTLYPTSAEPGLWGNLAVGSRLNSATIRVRAGKLAEYITYTLTNVTITSFSTTLARFRNAPQDTIQLAYDAISESYPTTNADGKAQNIATYNQVTGVSTATGSLADPSAVGSPPAGLTFVEDGVTGTELAVATYSWGSSNPSGVRGAASLQNFVLTLATTSAEPGLWGRLVVGKPLNSAIIRVRIGKGDEYLTYTLTNVTIAAFSTSGSDGEAAQATIQLAFDSVSESYRPINADRTLGAPNVATYNQKSGSISPIGGPTRSLTDPAAQSSPSVGLAFVVGGGTLPELSVASYSWGATNPGGSGNTAKLQSFTVTLAPTSAEPGLWRLLVSGAERISATIRVRSSTGNSPVEYLTYTLTDVSITSFSTNRSASGALPQDTIELAYGSVSESYRPLDVFGRLDSSSNFAQYDVVSRSSRATGSLSAPVTDFPSVGLTFNGKELAVASYSWGAGNPSDGKSIASLQSFTLTLYPTSAEPGLWGNLAAGSRLNSATIRVRNARLAEYITYTLTNVTITSFLTTLAGFREPTLDTIQLTYDAISESYRPSSLGGVSKNANTVTYNQVTGVLSATPSDTARLVLSVNSSADEIVANSNLSLLEAASLANGTLSFSALSAAEKARITVVDGLTSPITFATRPLILQINLASGTYSDVNLHPPAGVTVILKGSGADTIIVGHSPALTVTGGDVEIEDVTLETATDSPTVLVTDGKLTLRDDVIQEAPGFNDPAVVVTGGMADLGTEDDPGNNRVEGQGNFLSAADPAEVKVGGDMFDLHTSTNTASEPTSTTVTTHTATTVFGQSARLTATVTAWNGGTPTGNVHFLDVTSGADLGSAPLTLIRGVAQAALTIVDRSVASHEIRAAYIGDNAFIPSEDVAMAEAAVPLGGGRGNERTYVNALYRYLLGRDAEAGGLTYWAGLLTEGLSRQKVATGLLNSDEGHLKQINDLYHMYLGRSGEEGGVQAHLHFLDQGGTLQDLQASFFTSAEFVARSGGTPEDYVDALYHTLLDRSSAGDAGASSFVTLIQHGGDSAAIVQAIQTSQEGSQMLAGRLYDLFLGRYADGDGLRFWTARLQEGGFAEEQAVVSFLGSDEFFNRR
jgi:type VI protein secretion system component Hcp